MVGCTCQERSLLFRDPVSGLIGDANGAQLYLLLEILGPYGEERHCGGIYM